MKYILPAACLMLLLFSGTATQRLTAQKDAIQETVERYTENLESRDITTFTADKAHSKIGFKVRHLGITNVNGGFDDYEAKVMLDPADLSTFQAEATVQIASINTGIDRRDNHLRSDDFFNAEMYPTMRFISKEVKNIAGSEFELVGDLTIRDVTKEVIFEVEFLGMGKMGETQKAGFAAEARINRFDYNLKWDRVTEAGGLVVSEEIRILLDLEMNEEAEQ